jgi:hypothetical protein
MRTFPSRIAGARVIESCPVCDSKRIEYEFTVANRHVAKCTDCTMLFLRESNAAAFRDETIEARIQKCIANFRIRVPGTTQRKLVLVPQGSRVPECDCDVLAFEEFLSGPIDLSKYTSIICVDLLDRIPDPAHFLELLRSTTSPQTTFAFTHRSVDSIGATYAGSSWTGFRSGAARFFGTDTLQCLLARSHFGEMRTYSDSRLERISFRVRAAGMLLAATRLLKPASIFEQNFRILDDSFTIICRSVEARTRQSLSVIVPVYNERRTFDEMMRQLVAKQIEDIDIEIIIVESNSTDGSRENVLSFAADPRVTVLLQDAPRGKGNAVRAGLARATGDIVLFQDADLEYEIEDYDDLIRPIATFQRNFIIGSRHGRSKKSWKIREFNGAPVLSQVFNLGHIIFLLLFNFIYGQRLADPFSMFKVFRRDAIAGLRFECDRFDFDFEIVIKLLRKGYKPLEIPVNYHARSITEGKKVTMVRDPLTWLRALARFRNCELYK